MSGENNQPICLKDNDLANDTRNNDKIYLITKRYEKFNAYTLTIPEIISLFATKQTEKLRMKLSDIENDHKNGLLSNDQFNNQKLETLFALNSLEQALSNEEQNYLKENIKEDAENDLDEPIALDVNETELDFTHCRICSLSNFTVLTKTNVLGLRNNLIEKIEGLSQLISLRELELYDNQITKIENIDTLINLEILDLSFNRIKKIEGIDKLINLKKLFLVNNQISKIENLDKLTNLETLELGANRIQKIENLESLNKLENLFLGKNKISKLENLDQLKSLKLLSIQSNRLIVIENLECLDNLDQLYLSQNGIKCIENLDKNIKLNTLDLAENQIVKLENIEHLTELEELWCNNNKIDDWNNVSILEKLPKLTTIYLEHNPISKDNMYRKKLMLIAPRLMQIDATMCR